MESIDVAVIGAGVTGLASAAAIAQRGLSVCVLERHARPGLETSTHNSGVIHAGMYYPTGSLKAALCVEGAQRLYAFCSAQGVPHSRIGKLIVAAEQSEVPALAALKDRGDANGVTGLELVGPRFIAQREPAVHAVAALYSPDTGILDADSYARALLRDAEQAGAIFLPASPVGGFDDDAGGGGIALRTDRETILARQVVNAAGLYADDVSASLGGERFTIYPCRGEYVELTPAKRGIVNGLVYPLPHAHSLGVHVVKTTTGAVWLGPTARYQERKDDYENDRLPVEAFVEPARRLLNGIRADDLRLSGSGIRPKLQAPDAAFADFMIRRDRVNPRLVHAAGIESPGLTASLAVGSLVARIVAEGAP
jgi:L-2-hydroxyglutarate oxidase LhgO